MTKGVFTGEAPAGSQTESWFDCPTPGSLACTRMTVTGASHTLGAGDPVGDYVREDETASNATGTNTAWSNSIGPITAAAATPINKTMPTLSGGAVLGNTDTLTPGTYTGATGGQTEMWNWCPSATATSTCTSGTDTGNSYTLYSAMPTGVYMRVSEVATNAHGTTTEWSNAVGPVTAASGSAPPSTPANTVMPSLAGGSTVGSVSTATAGTFTGESPAGNQGDAFEDCPSASSTSCTGVGGTGSTYTLATADVASYVRVKETATNANGNTVVWSNAIGPVTASGGSGGGTSMPTTIPSGPWGATTMSDDFTGSSVNQSTWHLYDNQEVFGSSTSGTTHGNGPWWNASHSVEGGGILALKIYQDTGEGQPAGTWESGGVGANTSLAQTYGKWEVRAKFPNGAGMGGVFLLWPQSGNWPSGGEIDFAETPGNSPRNNAYLTNHWACAGTNNDCNLQLQTSVDWNVYHTFGVEWTPGKIVYTIDGNTVGTSTSNVPTDPMYLTMQDSETPPSACGGWYVCVNSTTPAETDMDVDWVEAWKYQ